MNGEHVLKLSNIYLVIHWAGALSCLQLLSTQDPYGSSARFVEDLLISCNSSVYPGPDILNRLQ